MLKTIPLREKSRLKSLRFLTIHCVRNNIRKLATYFQKGTGTPSLCTQFALRFFNPSPHLASPANLQELHSTHSVLKKSHKPIYIYIL